MSRSTKAPRRRPASGFYGVTKQRSNWTEVGKPVVRKKNPRFQRKKVLIAGLAGKIGGKVKVGSPLAH